MKRWIHASSKKNVRSTSDYISTIDKIIKQESLVDLIDTYEWRTASGQLKDMNIDVYHCYLSIVLKDEFACKYYRRVRQYVRYIDIIPDRDWMSSGAPELYVYIRPDLLEAEIHSKIKNLVDRIEEYTQRYQEQVNQQQGQ